MRDMDEHLQMAKSLAKLLDSQFSLFGFRFGLDPLFDLIPGVGTIIPTMLSLYIVWIAYNYNVGTMKLLRMILNVVWDGLIGVIPIGGTVIDSIFKANERNLRILEKHLSLQ